MKSAVFSVTLSLVLLASPVITLAATPTADLKKGEQLVNDNCINCHEARFGNNGSDIYTRPDRRVTSLTGLKKQVIRCRDNLGLKWFDEDVDDVVAYLNKTYYKFKK